MTKIIKIISFFSHPSKTRISNGFYVNSFYCRLLSFLFLAFEEENSSIRKKGELKDVFVGRPRRESLKCDGRQ
jgi:hypothetical protein